MAARVFLANSSVRQQAVQRKLKRQLHLETRQQRVVVHGWDCGVNPVRVFEVFEAACKVEACYSRQSGKQGTLVVCFREECEAHAARGRHSTTPGGEVVAVEAYSMRLVSCERWVVRGWWKEGEWS